MKKVNLRENNYSLKDVSRDMEIIRFYVGQINSWVDMGLHAERLWVDVDMGPHADRLWGEVDQYIGHVEASLASLYDSIDHMKERTTS